MATPPCPRCMGPLVQISITLDDHPLVMRSCSKCDRRSWHRHGETIDVGHFVPARRRKAAAGAA